MDIYSFYTGMCFNAYEFLGAHKENKGYVFRVFAPNAAKISVMGDFNSFTETEMYKIYDGNFYEICVPNAEQDMKYFYRIYNDKGEYTDHGDIYGCGMKLRPGFKSVLRDLSEYKFKDDKWMNSRTDCKNKPLNIYEVHLGSWHRKKDDS